MSDIPQAMELLSQVIAESTLRSEEEKRALENEIADLKVEIELLSQATKLLSQAATEKEQGEPQAPASEPERYHGCYNLNKRRSAVRTAGEVLIILGGQKHVAAILGVSEGTTSGWRDSDYLPKRFRDPIDEMMKERGYYVEKLLYK